MKAEFNFAKRIDPQTKVEKWYATPASKGAMDADETAQMAVVDTTLSKGEFKHAMEVATEKLIPLILSGISVTIGDLGKLRLSFGSKGVENMEDFNAQSMIQNAKIIFTPSSQLKQALKTANFEVAGVVEDGIKYGSVRSYRLAKGLDTPEPSEPGGSGETGEGEDEGGSTLG